MILVVVRWLFESRGWDIVMLKMERLQSEQRLRALLI